MLAPSRGSRLTAVAFLLLIGTADVSAQFPPDSLVNLRFFPEDIETRALVDQMRGFALGLGVRCQYCHVGEEGMPLAEFDFPSDEKPAKQKAREMLKMVHEINTVHLANLPEQAEPNVAVQCVTCHRGQAKPILIEDRFTRTMQEHGVDSAQAEYRALRDEYYGSFTYDFSELTLSMLAQSLAGQQQLQEAMAVLELNEEFYPESAGIQYMMGEMLAAAGDRQGAIARFERAVEMNPNFTRARQRLEQLRQP